MSFKVVAVADLSMPDLLERKKRAGKLLKKLAELYPDAECALTYASPLELLVATILSAQCTDERVNQTTPALFARYRTAQDYADADLAELERLVHPTGFYRNKARNIRDCCRQLLDRHGGEVPPRLDDLVVLPGVGRKTANVVLSDAFDVPGITVDTHVGRLSRRWGLTTHDDPVKVEFDLIVLLPKRQWNRYNHRTITHGRRVCHSRKPECPTCPLRRLCPRVGVAEPEGAPRAP